MEDIRATGRGTPVGMTELFELGSRTVLPVFREWGWWLSQDQDGMKQPPTTRHPGHPTAFLPISCLLPDSGHLAWESW